MNFFEKILYFLQGKMDRPLSYGWFHIMWIILIILMLLFLYSKRSKYSDKQLKWVLGVYGIVAFLLELLKQLIWTFNYDPTTFIITYDYQWYAFPFQLCTTPIFVCIICLFLKKNKCRDYLLAYMAFVTILGSIATMVLPDSCFTSDILVNIHTMWLHAGSLVVSIYLLLTHEVELDKYYLKGAFLIFLLFVLMALLLNIAVYNMNVLNGEVFNMFYISPYFESILPCFDVIYRLVPYFVFLIIYIFVILLGSFLIFYLAKLVSFVLSKK